MKTSDIQRFTSVPFGAFAVRVMTDHQMPQAIELSQGTGQLVYPLDMPSNLKGMIVEGRRATPIFEGDWVVRSTRFGRGGSKAKLVVMDRDRFGETFGDQSDGFPHPNFPEDISHSGRSEDEVARRDYDIQPNSFEST